uniref:Small ribosomal subunit protein uS8c n=2 Tax=Welwitschia mirabilis TaxID=3377 RepID=RR8_WELMI|nr:ribosomal protein S8 [Welwitschia mirabilis]B2Y1Z5.1 RecName: Full=Small ribosomal subunit protein uS8c; AltName: Full=30S ribosomal protein S8, chloroplastic [Welwitschia mirabilis]ABY26825.1 ribosomal protein S8 [Welwitschia mirabilis]AMA21078.1 ribosomal protein S8 [Welwitschia mirabilis]BAH11193.1 ribosomal protein S8 [Welwitschia mirabilis]
MDTIANLITSIRNAYIVDKKIVRVTATRTNENIGRILLQEGFIKSIREHKDGQKSFLIFTLKYRKKKEKRITLKRISKPGRKIYSDFPNMPKVLGGMGIAIVSTSRGIMTDREARQKKIGGEILCYVW